MVENIVQMSADSKVFTRGNWRGCLGVCICYVNPASFKKSYNELMVSTFKKYGLKKEKDVFSSRDISKLFGSDRIKFLECLESLVAAFGKLDGVTINIVYTTLTLRLIPKGVPCYGKGRYATKYVPSQKFLSVLSQYYPYICAWIVHKRARMSRTAVYLDSLQGEITEAWDELVHNHNVWVIPNGDLCNLFVSAADLCVRYIDEKLYSVKGGLYGDDLEKLCKDIGIEARVHYVGHKELDEIKPIERKPLPLHYCFKRPMIFILKEQLMDKEIEYVRKRPKLMMSLDKYAHKVDSGYKFIDYSKDFRYLKDGDHLIYLGSRGKEQTEYLKNIGWELTIQSITDL